MTDIDWRDYANEWVKEYLYSKCHEINDWLSYEAPAFGSEVAKAKAI